MRKKENLGRYCKKTRYFIILIFIVGISILLCNNSMQETILKDEIEENVLAIFLDDEPINYIPKKDTGYTLDLIKSSCNNGVELLFDYNTWTIKTNYSNYENKDNARVKCSLYFRDAREYTISYDLNGGTGEIASQIKIEGKTLFLTEQVPMKENYTFLGWSTIKDGNIEYKSGADFERNEDTILYAVYGIQYLYHYGNQYTNDTGGWRYTRIFKPSEEGSTIMRENDIVTFADQYIEWKELQPEIKEYAYYGAGFFITDQKLDLSNAKSIHFEYEILVATPAIAPSDQNMYYPWVNFFVVDSNEKVLKSIELAVKEISDGIDVADLNLDDNSLKNVQVKIDLGTTGTGENELQFRLYSIYVTY